VARPGSAGAGKGMNLMGGACMAVTTERERAYLLKCANLKEMRLLVNTPRLRRGGRGLLGEAG
jgi:hypothetical protein